MCGGGGSPGASNDGYYYSQEMKAQREDENRRADAAALKAEQDKGVQYANFYKASEDAANAGQTDFRSYLDKSGIAYDEPTFAKMLQSISRSVPELDPNPRSYYTDEAFQRGLSSEATPTRNMLNSQIRNQFKPGYEKSLIADTADDDIISKILGEQRSTAQSTLDFGRKRGMLNDVGYNRALAELGNQESAGRSTLSDIGTSVLGVDRDAVKAIGDKASTLASGWNYGDTTPDISSLYGEAQSTAADKLSGLEGSIRGKAAGINVFDPAKALQIGGTQQGPINPSNMPGAAGSFAMADAGASKKRGLGGTNVF